MSSFACAFDAICQSCDKRFKIKERFSAVINLDIAGFERDGFLTGKLNRLKCPICGSEFTYEIPMIVFSMKKKFAILIEPNLTRGNLDKIKNPPHVILPDDFEFRAVRYLTEAKEKYDIYSYSLDDTVIEYIKLQSFSDDMAMPFNERNMVFVSYDDGIYTFYQVDYNDNILNTYHVEFENNNIPEYILNMTKSHNSWLKIDREALKEEIKCQNTKTSL